MPSVIKHTLALTLKLSDATNGGLIESGIRFSIDGKPRRPLPKPEGYFVFLTEDLPEASFDLDVRASGYVPTTRRVLLEAPGIGPPLLSVEMVPEEGLSWNMRFGTLSGERKGLVAIDAVRVGEKICFAGAFDARKRMLTVYNPYRHTFNRTRYALVDPAGLRYEPFVIESYASDETFKIDHPFVSAVSAESPIAPVVVGLVRADGTYLLRVRDESLDNRWIVRFTEAEGERFELVDFNEPETARLKASEKSKKN
ncbi:MAG: hypothetical protein LBS24_06190 [Clostridiales Family XIII bacterium]|nr:hypothetical protein [Clostridiales Family XIII bacterium]